MCLAFSVSLCGNRLVCSVVRTHPGPAPGPNPDPVGRVSFRKVPFYQEETLSGTRVTEVAPPAHDTDTRGENNCLQFTSRGIHLSLWSGSGAVAGGSHSVKNVYVTLSSVCEIEHMVGRSLL